MFFVKCDLYVCDWHCYFGEVSIYAIHNLFINPWILWLYWLFFSFIYSIFSHLYFAFGFYVFYFENFKVTTNMIFFPLYINILYIFTHDFYILL